MTEKRYLLVKCIQNQWGIVDKTLEGVDQLILMHHSKLTLKKLVDELNEKEQLKQENKELKEINQDNQDYISLLQEEKINLQIKLQKIRDYAMEDGEVKQGVIEKVICE